MSHLKNPGLPRAKIILFHRKALHSCSEILDLEMREHDLSFLQD